jgi:hypothetical protein
MAGIVAREEDAVAKIGTTVIITEGPHKGEPGKIHERWILTPSWDLVIRLEHKALDCAVKKSWVEGADE